MQRKRRSISFNADLLPSGMAPYVRAAGGRVNLLRLTLASSARPSPLRSVDRFRSYRLWLFSVGGRAQPFPLPPPTLFFRDMVSMVERQASLRHRPASQPRRGYVCRQPAIFGVFTFQITGPPPATHFLTSLPAKVNAMEQDAQVSLWRAHGIPPCFVHEITASRPALPQISVCAGMSIRLR